MFHNNINYPSSPTVTKSTKTTEREFDAQGKVVKETITEVTESTRYSAAYTYGSGTTPAWDTHIRSTGGSQPLTSTIQGEDGQVRV